tara:strand:+ start:6472 stop:7356 length:885 start_codon:yes stop_codon:yes gene_type:complete
MSDTFTNSCKHWSSEYLAEMNSFYHFAKLDYKYLAECFKWDNFFASIQANVGGRSLRLLDVACGSGKFPEALISDFEKRNVNIDSIEISLLDPSSFSLDQATAVLKPPFNKTSSFEMKIQDFSFEARYFDILWAVHALYAVPKTDLRIALQSCLDVLGSVGFIAHASKASHYISYYDLFLKGFNSSDLPRFVCAEDILSTLKELKVNTRSFSINYSHRALPTELSKVEGYLQRCVFDDQISMDKMLENEYTGKYLKDDCKANDGSWVFTQEVILIFFGDLSEITFDSFVGERKL